MIGKRSLLVLLALALPLVPEDLAAQLAPAGPEQRVDTRVDLIPSCPRIAVASDRSFEIAWDYGGLWDFLVHSRHFDPAGEPTDPASIPLGPDGSINHSSGVDLVNALPDGFQVFFTHSEGILHDPEDFRQQLDLNGVPLGPPEKLEIGTVPLVGPAGILYSPFYQVRQENLAIQRVTADGTFQGRRIVLTSRPIGQPSFPQLAPQQGGNFVVAWNGLSAEKRPRQVLRARVVRGGAPFGKGDFDINTFPGGVKSGTPLLGDPLIASDPTTGTFAVAWTVEDALGNTSIHLRFFDAAGKPLSPESVAVPGAKPVVLVAAAFDDAGHLLLLWRPPLANALRARLFATVGGAPVGPAIQLSTVAGFQNCGSVAWAGDSWLITWLRSGDEGRNAVVWRRFTE